MNHVAEKLDTARFGLWLYLLSDVLLFGSIFATFMVLRHNTAGGPTGVDIVNPPFVFLQTILLLASSFTCALAVLSARVGFVRRSIVFIGLTVVLGATFFAMEIVEFATMLGAGESWQTSAFLSAFFTLVGVHGLHIFVGLLWACALLFVLRRRGLDDDMQRKLEHFGVFWHFLDIVWIFIFTVVYMFSVGVQ